jgi:hypothetical protein
VNYGFRFAILPALGIEIERLLVLSCKKFNSSFPNQFLSPFVDITSKNKLLFSSVEEEFMFI